MMPRFVQRMAMSDQIISENFTFVNTSINSLSNIGQSLKYLYQW